MLPGSGATQTPPEPAESPFRGSDVAIVLLCSLFVPGIASLFVTDFGAVSVFLILLPSQWVGNAFGLVLVARRRRATEADIGLPIVGRDARGIALGILAFAGILTVLGPLAEALELTDTGQVTIDAFSSISTTWVLVAAIVNVCVLAPLMEELTYRGVLHGALRRRLGGKATVVAGSLIFALAHVAGLDPETDRFALIAAFTVLEVFLLALLLGGLRERDGRIGRAFFAHGAWNAINLVAIMSLPYLEGV